MTITPGYYLWWIVACSRIMQELCNNHTNLSRVRFRQVSLIMKNNLKNTDFHVGQDISFCIKGIQYMCINIVTVM